MNHAVARRRPRQNTPTSEAIHPLRPTRLCYIAGRSLQRPSPRSCFRVTFQGGPPCLRPLQARHTRLPPHVLLRFNGLPASVPIENSTPSGTDSRGYHSHYLEGNRLAAEDSIHAFATSWTRPSRIARLGPVRPGELGLRYHGGGRRISDLFQFGRRRRPAAGRGHHPVRHGDGHRYGHRGGSGAFSRLAGRFRGHEEETPGRLSGPRGRGHGRHVLCPPGRLDIRRRAVHAGQYRHRRHVHFLTTPCCRTWRGRTRWTGSRRQDLRWDTWEAESSWRSTWRGSSFRKPSAWRIRPPPAAGRF